jgi:hypothetical protein
MTDEHRPDDIPSDDEVPSAPPPPPLADDFDDILDSLQTDSAAVDDEPLDDDDEYLDEEEEDVPAPSAAMSDFDIDAAIAALGSLDSVMSEQAAAEAAEQERLDAERRTEEEYQRWTASYQFPRPGMTRVQAGRPSSFVPAVGLIGLGALATFGSTLNLPVTPSLLAAIALAVGGLALVSYWLSSKRWARGAVFLGLTCLGGAILLMLPALTSLSLPAVAPLIAVGAALILTGLLSRPTSGGLSALGAGVVVASIAAIFLL